MSKKLVLGLLLGALLATVLPGTASAAITEAPESCYIQRHTKVNEYLSDCSSAADDCNYETEDAPCALCCLLGTVFYVTDLVFIGLIVLVMIFVLLGAFFILTAGGNTEKVNQGRDFILFALIGFAVAILAKGMPAIIAFFLKG